MNEVAELLGIRPPASNAESQNEIGGIDETHIELGQAELEVMKQVSKTASEALEQLRASSAAFESEIRQLSQEMNVLESRSSSLHHRLHTREHTLQLLEPMIESLPISSHVVSTIFEGEMDAQWYDALDRVRKPVKRDCGASKCVEGALKLRKVLIMRAVERIKAFYISRLRMLRRPGTNSQRVQLELVQSRASMDLLKEEAPRLASALSMAYSNTMKWYYTMLFGKYGRWLNRQPLLTMDAPKLLGMSIEQSGSGTLASMGLSAKNFDGLSIGARPSVIKATEEAMPALPMTSVAAASGAYPIEVLVRSLLLTLADSLEIESKVADVLTAPKPQPPTRGHSRQSSTASVASMDSSSDQTPLLEIIDPVLAFYGEIIDNWISKCTNDLFGLLIIVRLIDNSALKLWIQPWLTSITKKCWVHISKVCRLQASSIEHLALKASTVSAQATHGPHPLTHLVASYLSGILQLSQHEPEPTLSKGVKEIVEAYELFVSKLASGNEKVLYNNYFVMSVLLADIAGPLAKELATHFDMLVNAFAVSAN